ncbi:MAG: CSLREA domain-containing protein, partial [Vicinamibacterales bacterium]
SATRTTCPGLAGKVLSTRWRAWIEGFSSAQTVLIPAAPAATFQVTKNTDTNDGTCNADCSLREAVIAPKRRRRRKAVTGGTTRLIRLDATFAADQSTGATASSDDDGVLRLDAEALRLPTALSEVGATRKHSLLPGRLVLTIVVSYCLHRAHTWFIAWMPER